MTPPAATAAGRSSAARPQPTREGSPGHRRGLRPQPAPRAPRRVSGPARGRARPAVAPRPSQTLGTRMLAVARSLPEHSLLDRLVRGRAWIPVLGVLLAGIVAMQVEVLKLGTSMGRSMQLSSSLQSQNESLQASVATLNDDQRIERLAAGMGLVMPAPTALSFLSARPSGDVGQAIANIHAPDPTGFTAQLTAEAAAAAAAAQASQPAVPATSTAGVSSTPSGGGTPTAQPTTPTSNSSAAASTTGSVPSGTATGTTGTGTGTAGTAGTGAGNAGTATGPGTGAAAIAPAGATQSSGANGG